MALSNLGLGFVIEAKDLASEIMEKVEHRFEKLETAAEHGGKSIAKSLSGVKLGMLELGAGLGVLGGAFLAAHEAGEFAHEIEAAGLTARATEEQLEGLKEAALSTDVAMRGFSPEEAAKALNALTHEGVNATDAVTDLDAALELARVTGKDVAEQAKFLSDTLDQFHMPAERAHDVVDKLVTATSLFGLNAAEMDQGLRGVASGAQLARASLDDTILTIGLAKRALPDVSQAARAANMAMTLLAEPKAQKSLKSLGVTITDTHGKMLPLIDVLSSLSEKTSKMTEAERANMLATTFGGRAAGGLSVILDQLSNGVTDSTGKLVTGAAAVEEFRKQLNDTEGAASKMADALSESLPGQEKIFSAAMKRLVTIVGTPFERVFAGILRTVNAVILKIGDMFNKLSPKTKEFISKVILMGGAFLAAAGAVSVFVAAWPMISALVVPVLTSLATAFAEVLVPLALVAGAAYLVKRAWESNLGGFRDFVVETYEKVSLIFRALVALFTEGKMTGPLVDEFRGASKGIQDFIITIFLWGSRIKAFFGALIDTVTGVFDQMGPQIKVLLDALHQVFAAFGLSGDGADDAAAKYKAFADAGMLVGKLIGFSLQVIVAAVTLAAEVFSSTISMMKSVFGGLLDAIRGTIEVISGVFTGNWGVAWLGLKRIVFGVVDAILAVVFHMASQIGAVIDSIAGMFGKDLGIAKGIEKFKADLSANQRVELGLASPNAGPGASPGVAAAGADAQGSAGIASALNSLANRKEGGAGQPPAPVVVQIDGETVAQAVAKHQGSSDTRGFVPKPPGFSPGWGT